MASPMSLVKRLRIFVSHPHVEWHETSTALGSDALREINETRRQRKLRAKLAKERQVELQGLRSAINERAPKAASSSQAQLSAQTTAHTHTGNDTAQEGNKAFMSTLEAGAAIAAPVYVHSQLSRASVAFANTAQEMGFASTQGVLSQQMGQQAVQRKVRIAGALPLAYAAAEPEMQIAANDQTRSGLPEQLQAAAVCLAVGDKTAARSQLKAALAQAPHDRLFAQAWLECLRACEEHQAFWAAAKALSELHEFELPPFYFSMDKGAMLERPSINNGQAGLSTGAPRPDMPRLMVPPELDKAAALALHAKVEQLQQSSESGDAVHAVLSFVRLKTIRPEAMHTLYQALLKLNDCNAKFVLQGGTVLLDVLLDNFSSQRSNPALEAWLAALQVCRLLNRADRYDVLLQAYSHLYINISAHNLSDVEGISEEYKWKPTHAKFVTFHRTVDDTADLAFSIEPNAAHAGQAFSSSGNNDSNTNGSGFQDSMLPVHTSYAQPVSQADRTVSLRLQGQGTHERIVRLLELADSAAKGYNAVSLDMTQTHYLRFDAAVALLNWAERKREQGISLKLHGHGLLMQALFEQISMGDAADLVPAYL
jgi:ABC-type transporter Mla MlaB component